MYKCDCGAKMKNIGGNDWECPKCHNVYEITSCEFEDEDGDEERLNVYDAALIWASKGKDEDYMFGYTEEELESAL